MTDEEKKAHREGVVAGLLYQRYCKAVGGKAWNGDPLPVWDEFRTDPAKALQVEGWMEVGRLALELIEGRE